MSCGEEVITPDVSAHIVHIIEGSFSPNTLTVASGDTVFFDNQEGESHQILSESSPGSFDATGDFDTGLILPGYQSLISIPEDAASGTVYYYYCGIFTDEMLTPDGEIHVE